MIYPMYSYRDVKTGFLPPMCEQNEQTAIRGFSFAVNNQNGNNIMNFSPKDYDLYKVGEFDTDTATIDPCIPVLVVSGASVFGV